MATTLEATSQPLSEPTISVATARLTSESNATSVPRRSESPSRGTRRPSQASSNNKHSKRHTNQPILVWLQRKIGGNKHSVKKQQANGLVNATNSFDGTAPLSNDSTVRGSVDNTVKGGRKHGTKTHDALARSVHSPSAKSDSLRPDSAWGMTLEPEADDDASIRPLPPTSPPSPVPSRLTQDSERTSGGYTSDIRSSRSAGTPSTKPTTLMSIELGAGGHIAQVPSISSSIQPQRGSQFAGPPTPTSGSPVSTRFPNTRGAIAGATAIQFSPFLPNATRSNTANSAAPSTVPGALNNLIAENTQTAPTTVIVSSPASAAPKLAIHIPGHSQIHPRNNPRPASPPPDNASTLTLASSTFAMSHASPRSRSMAAERERDLDNAASMRALRPSSRRGSWGSDETGWSAAALSTQTGVSSAGPMLLGFGGGAGSTTGGGYRRRGPGSIATARSAWSYRAGGKEGTGDGLDNVAGGDEDDCEEDDESPDGDGDRDTRVTADEATPTEDVVFDYATTSPTSINRQSIVLPHEIPLPASLGVTPTEIA